jgi:glycosyltransferase involved in cell wall biosynthesis
MPRERYAFVTVGPFSGINDAVRPRLAARFGELEETTLDTPTWTRGAKPLLAMNLLAVAREFGLGPLRDRGRLWGAFHRTAYLQRRLSRELEGRGPYAFTFQTQSLFSAAVPGCPHFIYTDHTALANRYYPDHDPASEPPAAWIARERSIYQHADGVFVMGSHVARSLQEHYGCDPSRVRTIGAGANVAAATASGEPGARHVVFVGRDWERKGGPDLLAAFARVRAELPDARLTIAGCRPDVGAQPGVEVRGDLDYAEVSQLYEEATVFGMPTLREPFGLVFVEALAHGVPVVATRLGALPDIVQDGESGLLVAPHDVDALAAALTRLLREPDTARAFGARGRDFVRDRFTWDAVADSLASEIRAVAGLSRA